MKDTAIILINWNGWKDTIECLDSFEWPLQHIHFFILDNNSADDSLQQLEHYFRNRQVAFRCVAAGELDNQPIPSHDVTLVINPVNQGFAGGNNIVLRHLLRSGRYPYAWLLNNDTVVKKDTLLRMQQHLENSPGDAFCGSVLLDYYTPELVQCCGVNYYKYLGVSKLYLKNRRWSEVESTLADTVHRPACYQIGASILADTARLKEIGLMDETFFIYSEEADWQIRARKLGYGNSLAWKSILYHKGSVSTAGRKHIFFFHYNRSAIIMSRKNFGLLPSLTASVSLLAVTIIRSKFVWKSIRFGIKGIFAGWSPRRKTH